MAGPKMAVLVLSEAERSELMLLSARRKTGQALALRARIVLECARGLEDRAVAARLRVAKGTVGKWRRRLVEHRLDGLRDDPRSGAPRTIEDADIEAVIVKTLESMPENATHWSSRGMAKASGISVSSVQRIWRAFGLQPHRIETFKLSTDPDFVVKSATLSGFTSRRPSTPSCSASMRRARFRRWTAASQCCRCGLAKPPGAATTTSVMVRLRCLPPSTSQPAT